MQKMLTGLTALVLVVIGASAALAQDWKGLPSSCSIPAPLVNQVQNQLVTVVNLSDNNGGLFKPHPNQMWSAVVDRTGHVCSVIKVGDAWPGSRDIAIAKASTPTISATSCSRCRQPICMRRHNPAGRSMG